MNNKYIYVSFVRSNTSSGKIIRKLTGWKYSHISITFDPQKDVFYAFSRLNYKSSFIAGYTIEHKSNYTMLKKGTASITYYKIPISIDEYKNIINFIKNIKDDSEYIFNYPSMFTTTILHGFELYKSYNCITFVSKILTFIKKVHLKKKYYKYDLNELEKELNKFFYKIEDFEIIKLDNKNLFFDEINFWERKKAEFKLLSECFYRLIFHKSSLKYNKKLHDEKIKKKSINTFNKLSKTYDYAFSGHNPRKNYDRILTIINKEKKKIKILDVGCGTGEILSKINSKHKLYGIDISPRMVEQAKKKDKNNKIEFFIGDAEQLPFEDNTFDLLLTSESFHHYPNPSNALSEFSRVLKNNGKLILCDMYRPLLIRKFMNFMFKFTNTGDVKMYSIMEISNLLQNYNFKIENREIYYSSYIFEARNEKNIR